MDQLTTSHQFQPVNYRRPWFKRPVFYFLIAVVIIVGYFSFRLGLIYNAISIENHRPWWSFFTNVVSVNKGEDNSWDNANPMPQPEKNRLDVLILGIRGSDAKSIEEEGGLLTDTILLASLDKSTKKAVLVSVPRDLFIDIKTRAPNGKKVEVKGKINEVYERGLANGGGIVFSKDVFSRLLGVYIDKAVVFDFNAFKDIVDNLSGIDIALAKPFEEPKQWGYPFSLPAGPNHLDGDKALYYVRSRYSSSDFDRARRQQEVIVAIKNKAATLGLFKNPLDVLKLFESLKNDVKTDFQIWDIRDLVSLADSFGSKIKPGNFVISTDNLLNESKGEKGEYILLPKEANYQGIKNWFGSILTQP